MVAASKPSGLDCLRSVDGVGYDPTHRKNRASSRNATLELLQRFFSQTERRFQNGFDRLVGHVSPRSCRARCGRGVVVVVNSMTGRGRRRRRGSVSGNCRSGGGDGRGSSRSSGVTQSGLPVVSEKSSHSGAPQSALVRGEGLRP